MTQIHKILKSNGQLLIQVPANHFHFSQTVAIEVAKEEPFKTELKGWYRQAPVCLPEEYSRMLYNLGFKEQKVFLRVYPHVLQSGDEIANWTKGFDFEKKMNFFWECKFIDFANF